MAAGYFVERRCGRPRLSRPLCARTINAPSNAALGSTLTFHDTAPAGNSFVAVEGSYDGGVKWQTLTAVASANGPYEAQITLNQRGLLQLRIVFGDGTRAAGTVNVG